VSHNRKVEMLGEVGSFSPLMYSKRYCRCMRTLVNVSGRKRTLVNVHGRK
jgi:hypothetical protein